MNHSPSQLISQETTEVTTSTTAPLQLEIFRSEQRSDNWVDNMEDSLKAHSEEIKVQGPQSAEEGHSSASSASVHQPSPEERQPPSSPLSDKGGPALYSVEDMESGFDDMVPVCPPGTPLSSETSSSENSNDDAGDISPVQREPPLGRRQQQNGIVVIQMPHESRNVLDSSYTTGFTDADLQRGINGGAFRARLGVTSACSEVSLESSYSPPPFYTVEDENDQYGYGSELSDKADDNGEDSRKDSGQESNLQTPAPARPVHYHTFIVFCLTVSLIVVIISARLYATISNSLDDGRWVRCWDIVFYPWIAFVMYFAIHVLMTNLFAAFGPVAHAYTNSKYYSTVVPPPFTGPLPRVTVQVPVYKESFALTLKPTLLSVLDACWHYEEEGGRSNVIIYDDGMLVISPAERRERRAFYKKHGIAYVARPGSGRKGRFKKASNLNFGMNLSIEVDARVAESNDTKSHGAALREIQEESNNVFRAAGDLRLGEFLLLIDSDTRIPEDCFAPLVAELKAYPEVAFIQSLTQPLQQLHDYWENAISHFTRMVYSVAILVACSGGDPAPLVGHNVFLRWSAMREVAVPDAEEQQFKFWSEDCVSEDFDYSMRVQARGYIGRYATYANDFMEGVSLTVHDEITRFRKYAFGAAEMLLNPIVDWPRKGVISKVFWQYVWCSKVPIQARMNILGYLGTYFAIASAPLAVLMNYFAREYFPMYREESTSGVDIMVVTFFVFFGIAPLGTCIIKYRLGLRWSLWEEYRPSLIYLIFFSGLGYHLLVAILCHLLSINMNFGITKKEVQQTNFFKEVKSTVRAYWLLYVWVLLGGGMIAGLYFAPEPYHIRNIFSIFPLAWLLFFHFFAPVILNPVLMLFKY